MSSGLLALAPRDRDGALRVVIESPAGSRVKLEYAREIGGFVLSRPLVLGMTYPFDWGFVPGTRASDGDPVDAMVLADVPTYPGVIVSCRVRALLEVEQDAKQGRKRERNDRLIVEPLVARRPTARLSKRLKQELEAFFVAVTLLERKNVAILGWKDARAAEASIDRSRHAR